MRDVRLQPSAGGGPGTRERTDQSRSRPRAVGTGSSGTTPSARLCPFQSPTPGTGTPQPDGAPVPGVEHQDVAQGGRSSAGPQAGEPVRRAVTPPHDLGDDHGPGGRRTRPNPPTCAAPPPPCRGRARCARPPRPWTRGQHHVPTPAILGAEERAQERPAQGAPRPPAGAHSILRGPFGAEDGRSVGCSIPHGKFPWHRIKTSSSHVGIRPSAKMPARVPRSGVRDALSRGTVDAPGVFRGGRGSRDAAAEGSDGSELPRKGRPRRRRTRSSSGLRGRRPWVCAGASEGRPARRGRRPPHPGAAPWRPGETPWRTASACARPRPRSSGVSFLQGVLCPAVLFGDVRYLVILSA